jgi:type I restriction enzyme S subunit
MKSIDELAWVGRGRSRHRPRNDPSLYGGEHPFVQTAEIHSADLTISTYSQTYSDRGLEQSKTWEPGTICITNAGENTGDCAILAIRACFPDRIIAVVADEKKSDAVFLKYAIDQLKPQFRRITRGATQDNLSLAKLLAFKFPSPPPETQKAVGAVLATYGALIENNRGRMALLEKTARLLYDEWFVRLRFPGHQRARMIGGLPEGWQPVPFSALADFVNGYPFKPEELGDDGLPIVKIPELRAGVSPKTPRNTGENIPEKYLLQDGNLLFSWSGTLLVEFWYDGPAILNQHLFRVETNDSCARVFMLQALRQALPEFTNQTTGATLKHIRKSALTTVKTNLPPRALLEQFDEFASMVYRQILSLRRQNSNLVKARDLLLPRLMSGEIAV